jgi:7 transmembrane receptor (rhodopsin family).
MGRNKNCSGYPFYSLTAQNTLSIMSFEDTLNTALYYLKYMNTLIYLSQQMRLLVVAFVLLACGIYGQSTGHGSVVASTRRGINMHVTPTVVAESSTATAIQPKASGSVYQLGDSVHNTTNGSVDVDEAFKRFFVVKKYLDPTINAIIFIFGSVANITLLVILARHEEMRTAANACIFSMAVGDLLSIIMNVPVFYVLLTSEKWTVGVTLCKFMWFLSDFAVGLSIFAVTMLSVQRYHGIVNTNIYVYNGRLAVRSRLISRLNVAFIWILSFSFALRTAVTSDVDNDECSSVARAYGIQFAKNIALMNLLVFCIIPLCVIAVFYGLTARCLIASARNMPGEMTPMNQKIKFSRRKGANTVLALAGAFFVSYVPWFAWQVVDWAYYSNDYKTATYIYTFLYYLFFGNLLFNPVALYCVSSTWRRHFNRYLLCIREGDVTRADDKPTTCTNYKSNVFTSSTNLTAQSVEDKRF